MLPLRHTVYASFAAVTLVWTTVTVATPILDRLDFGTPASEAAHHCTAETGPDNTPCGCAAAERLTIRPRSTVVVRVRE